MVFWEKWAKINPVRAGGAKHSRAMGKDGIYSHGDVPFSHFPDKPRLDPMG